MKVGEISLRRRLMELGLVSLSDIELTRYWCGYTVEIRGAKYAIDESAAKVTMELINEAR